MGKVRGGGDEKDIGWLEIGSKKFDVWAISNKVRVPPIIILSACSTHSVDGSHASVVNGFLKGGAYSVIGTLAPVNSNHAALFVARLLHRVSEYVPARLLLGPITWRYVISNFLRMSYATDILYDLNFIKKSITNSQCLKLHEKINHLINSDDPLWYEGFIELLSNEMDLSSCSIQSLLESNYQFTETMLYSQFGRSENIVITL